MLELNKDIKQGHFLTILEPKPNEVMEEAHPIGETSIISNAKFVISTDVNLPHNDEEKLESQIQNNTLFVLKNSKRRSLIEAAALVDKNPRLKERIKNAPSNRIFLIISSLLCADSLSFKLKNADDTNEGVQIFKISKFNVHIQYECQGSLNVIAEQGDLFFKVNMLKYNSSSCNIEADISEDIDLSNYNFMYAF